MVNGWELKSLQECLEFLGTKATVSTGDVYCNATWDSLLCWPATPAGQTAELPCPPLVPLDQTKTANRVCDARGSWVGHSVYHNSSLNTYDGWTNYTLCYTEMTRQLNFRLTHHIPLQQLKVHAFAARLMETIGLLLSLFSLVASTFIFCYFRSIRSSPRIRIHRNLFSSVLVYTIILLIKNLDQAISIKTPQGFVITGRSIGSVEIVCQAMIVLLEFTKSAMFSWMLIQGLHLQITLSSVFNVTPNYRLYYGIGWGAPILITLPWAIVNVLLNHEGCWYGYEYQKYFYAIEVPRFLILFVNLCIIVSVVRMLISKLRSNRSPEKEQIKKAVKAMIFLLPPLGANNLLHCTWPPISSIALYAVHLYASYFLSAFQGFFMALFFCFLNSEVKSALKQHWHRSRQSRLSISSLQGSNSNRSQQFTCLSEIVTDGRSHQRGVRHSDAANSASFELFPKNRHETISSEQEIDGNY